MNQDFSLILLAAGSSTRFIQSLPPKLPPIKKQWWIYQGLPLWEKVYRDFKALNCFEQIFLVVSNSLEQIYIKQTLEDLELSVILGGKSRQESVLNALKLVQTPFVVVSDVARFKGGAQMFLKMLDRFKNQPKLDGIAPALSASDTMVLNQQGYTLLDRTHTLHVQTPQICRTEKLKEAYNKGTFSDESSALLSSGGQVSYIEGSLDLHKLTFAQDLPPYTTCLTTHTGLGFDVHGFEANKPMKIGGVLIDSKDSKEQGFKAHSDGDVLLHALIDAILGAIKGGDIGMYYSDQDLRFKNMDSSLMLTQIYHLARGIGHTIEGIDCTLLADKPKIAPYRGAIKSRLADLLHLNKRTINLKATTFEGLGFIGRKEGVGAQVLVQTSALSVIYQ
ncbi:2-C-methyl-D-erythritol 2,4-cyclodiphosphate synthase [Helicobacter suis]|uniref:2-C-methyl-D-erythritol 2,4-cyclodiphosphate synthase n=1 Tax=Helicobacter suis TaxID=104628 RepID=UPI0013D43D70|nr:2-C-methyl-D-erythritol 2,4-cyclodiphosphate synthase [Helicobacter suis]